MDLEIIVVDRIDVGIYTLEKQTESTIDVYDVVVKIIEVTKKENI